MPVTTDPATTDNRAAISANEPFRGRIAILTADQVEDMEFFYPYYRFVEASYDVDVLTPTGDTVTGYKGLALRTGLQRIDTADPADYELLYIPGGLAPAEVRTIPEALEFVRRFADTGKIIGAVCHGPQVLASAGLLGGRTMTSWYDVADEVRAAGGTWINSPVVEDGQFITARKPGDMPQELARIFTRLESDAAAAHV